MKLITFIGGRFFCNFETPYGGTPMTCHLFRKSFENDTEYKLICKERSDFKTAQEITGFLKQGDISHIDDYSILLLLYEAGLEAPDVIGPIARSPVKAYKDWLPKYAEDWFYKAKVIRLNDGEERNSPRIKEIHYIIHGIDTDYLQPDYSAPKKYVLWAGNHKRYAKNFKMFEDIMAITQLPNGYEFKVLTNYTPEQYWALLDETAILVNTSFYESFCCALFEARAKGVATIQQIGLNGNQHRFAELQVEYNKDAYKTAILDLLKNRLYLTYGRLNRNYVMQNCTLNQMRDSYKKVFDSIEVLSRKHTENYA